MLDGDLCFGGSWVGSDGVGNEGKLMVVVVLYGVVREGGSWVEL